MSERARQSRRKTIDDIDAEVARLKEQRRQVRARSAERFARIALETGLADLRIDDAEIAEAFRALAGRFRGPGGDAEGNPGEASSAA